MKSKMNFKLEKQITNNVVSVNDQDIFLQTESGLHLTSQLLRDVQQNVIQKYPLRNLKSWPLKIHQYPTSSKMVVNYQTMGKCYEISTV